MKIKATKVTTYKIEARDCTPEEVAKLLKDIGSPDVYEGDVEIRQEYKYYDGYPTSTGLYAVIFNGGANSDTVRLTKEEVEMKFDPQTVEAFFESDS